MAVAQLEDARRVLAIENLHNDVQQSLQPVISRLDNRQSFDELVQEIPILSNIRDSMITDDPGGDPGAPLSLSSVSPTVLEAGGTLDVTVTGTGIQDGATAVVCRRGTTINSVAVPAATTLVANVTIAADATGRRCGVVITNPDGTSDALPRGTITITAGAPGDGGDPLSLTSVSPTVLEAGATLDVTVTGTGIQDGATAVVCRRGTTINSVTVPAATTLVANVTIAPDATGRRCGVVITNPDGGSEVLSRGSITIQ